MPDAIRWLGEENCAEVFALLGWDHPGDELDHSRVHGLGAGRDETAQPGDWIVPVGDWFRPVPDDVYGAMMPGEIPDGPQPEYPPPRAWPRTPGVHHVQFDETAHPVGECTDACRAVGGPYVARPGWIVRVQAYTPLHGPDPGGHRQAGDGPGSPP